MPTWIVKQRCAIQTQTARAVYFREHGHLGERRRAIPVCQRSIVAGCLRARDYTPGPSAGREAAAAARFGAGGGHPQSSSCLLLVASQIRWIAVAARRIGSDSAAISPAIG